MNGRKGRARTLARIHKRRLAEAAVAGIDITDREAVDRFHLEKLAAIIRRAKEELP